MNKKLVELSGCSSTVVKSLVDKSIFEEYYLVKDRVTFEKEENSNFTLSEAQQNAFDSIKKNLEELFAMNQDERYIILEPNSR